MAIIHVINEYGEAAGPIPAAPKLDLDQYPMGAAPGVLDQLKDHLRRNWLKYLLAGGFFGYHANKKYNNYHVKLNDAKMAQNAFTQMQQLHNELINNVDKYSDLQKMQMYSAYRHLAAQLMPNQAAIIHNFGDNVGDFIHFMDSQNKVGGLALAAKEVQRRQQESDKAAKTYTKSYLGGVLQKLGLTKPETFEDPNNGLSKAVSDVNQLMQAQTRNSQDDLKNIHDTVSQLQDNPQSVPNPNEPQNTSTNSDSQSNRSDQSNGSSQTQAAQNQRTFDNMAPDELLNFANDHFSNDSYRPIGIGTQYGEIAISKDIPGISRYLFAKDSSKKNSALDVDQLREYNSLMKLYSQVHNQFNSEESDPNETYGNLRLLVHKLRAFGNKYPGFLEKAINIDKNTNITGEDDSLVRVAHFARALNNFNNHFNPLFPSENTDQSSNQTQPNAEVSKKPSVGDQVANALSNPADQSSAQPPAQPPASNPTVSQPPVQPPVQPPASNPTVSQPPAQPPVQPPAPSTNSTHTQKPIISSEPPVDVLRKQQAQSRSSLPVMGKNESLYKEFPKLKMIHEMIYSFNEDESDTYTYSEPKNEQKKSGSNSKLKTIGKILAAGGLAALGAGAIHQIKNSHLQNAEMYKQAKQNQQSLNSLAKANTLDSVDVIGKVKDLKDKYMANDQTD